MIELSGLWEGTTKSGDTYFSGYLGKAKVLIFKNKHKKDEKHPDYIIYLDEKKDDKKQNNNSNQRTKNGSNEFESEELPF